MHLLKNAYFFCVRPPLNLGASGQVGMEPSNPSSRTELSRVGQTSGYPTLIPSTCNCSKNICATNQQQTEQNTYQHFPWKGPGCLRGLPRSLEITKFKGFSEATTHGALESRASIPLMSVGMAWLRHLPVTVSRNDQKQNRKISTAVRCF